MKAPIHISNELWKQTWSGLLERGNAKKETLCVWAGTRFNDRQHVTEIIFVDDLDGVEGFALFHRVSKESVATLFQILRSKGLELIADVHTHPSDWVGLSLTDQEHPLEYRIGFISIVLPHYADSIPDIKSIGMHEYCGQEKWSTLTIAQKNDFLKIAGVI